MKHLFIVNPTAGGQDKTMEVSLAVKKALRDSADEYEVYVTTAPMDAAEKIREEAKNCDHLRVYACGGDGTFNECVCGAALLENVAVCPYPTGTGNDFCRMFGEEKDLFRDLGALLRGTEQPIDLIDCNGRYSANICSVGIDARVGTSVHEYGSIPFLGKGSAYVVSAAVNVFKGIASPMTIRCGDFFHSGKTTLACACNGRFYGGGFNPSRKARPDDGIMDIYIVKKVNLLEFALLIGKYAAGESDKLTRYVTHLRTAEALEMEFDGTEVVNVDGEAMRADKLTMRMVPKALQLIVPKGMTFFEDETL